MTELLLAVSMACNLWFLFLLFYDRIMESKLFRFFKGVVDVWRSLNCTATKQQAVREEAPADTSDIIGKSRFKMAPTRTNAAIPVQEAATPEKGIELSEEEATFDDGNGNPSSYPAQVPEDRLDETFTSVPPSDMEFGEEEPEETSGERRASGYSFDEIGEAVGIAGKYSPTKNEKRQAGKVLSELDGTELLDKLNKSVKLKITGLIDFYLYGEPMTPTIKAEAKNGLETPERLENFNIRDFV